MPSNNEYVEDIHFGKEEIFELIGRPPGWILHSGISLIAYLLIIMLLVSNWISYSDKISCIGVIRTQNPALEVQMKSSGIIDTIFVQEEQEVKENSTILYLKNLANRHDIQILMNWIEKYDKQLKEEQRLKIMFEFPSRLILGDLQILHGSLELKIREFRQVLSQTGFQQKIATIDQEIGGLKKLNLILQKEKELTKEELGLSENSLNRSLQLYKHKAITIEELEQAKASHLSFRKNYNLKNNGLIQNGIRITQLEKEKIQVEEERRAIIQKYQFQIIEIVEGLKNQYFNWVNDHFVRATARGIFSKKSDISTGMNLPAGSVIGLIIPHEQENPKYARLQVPSIGKGKIKIGDKIIIKLDAYPAKEFGIVKATITKISPILEIGLDNLAFYEMQANLTPEIITDYISSIPYTPEMPITGDIITENRTLLSRFFNELLQVIK